MSEPVRPPRGTYLIQGGALITMDPAVGTLRRGDVFIREGRIEQVGTVDAPPAAELIDASGMIVMPGMIDSHFHMWSAIGRNFVTDGFEYFPAKWATAAAYEPADFYDSVLLALVECANAGITTVHNWSHNTRTLAHAEAELAAHRDGMLRARYSYGHRDGIPGDEALDFAPIDRVAADWFGPSSPLDGLVHLGVNLRGPDLGDDRVFDQEMREAQERGLPVSIHTVQGGTTAVCARHLADRGYLGPAFLIAHFLAATDEDRRLMAATGTPLSYAVHSELRLGDAGDPRSALLKMLNAGVTVSFSIDATSLAPVNLFEAMNIAWNMGIPWQGTDTQDIPPLTIHQCLEMATINGARALGIADLTGSITPGKRADIILVRASDLNTAPLAEIETTIVRSATPANVDTVIVDGRILKRHGQLTVHDAHQIVRRAEEAARRVRRRAGGRLAEGLAPDGPALSIG